MTRPPAAHRYCSNSLCQRRGGALKRRSASSSAAAAAQRAQQGTPPSVCVEQRQQIEYLFYHSDTTEGRRLRQLGLQHGARPAGARCGGGLWWKGVVVAPAAASNRQQPAAAAAAAAAAPAAKWWWVRFADGVHAVEVEPAQHGAVSSHHHHAASRRRRRRRRRLMCRARATVTGTVGESLSVVLTNSLIDVDRVWRRQVWRSIGFVGGEWAPAMDAALTALVLEHGEGEWPAKAEAMGFGHSGLQLAHRWSTVLAAASQAACSIWCARVVHARWPRDGCSAEMVVVVVGGCFKLLHDWCGGPRSAHSALFVCRLFVCAAGWLWLAGWLLQCQGDA
jgi:hypothetical protein